MGFFDKLKRLFGKRGLGQAIQSDPERFKALQITDSKRFESLESPIQSASKRSEALQIDKEALKLGLAAGYTGYFIRNIEDALSRIENNMITKEWFTIEVKTNLERIYETLLSLKELAERHEELSIKRFESLQRALNRLRGLAEQVEEPIKSDILGEVEKIESHLPLTPRMQRILSILKERKVMSYQELAELLGYKNESTLRGILSIMARRTGKIKRFVKDGKGWVRYVNSQTPFTESLEEAVLEKPEIGEIFESLVKSLGYWVEKRPFTPHFILQKEGRKVGAEVITEGNKETLPRILGEFLMARETYRLDELWLVLPSRQTPSEDLKRLFYKENIKVYLLDEEKKALRACSGALQSTPEATHDQDSLGTI